MPESQAITLQRGGGYAGARLGMREPQQLGDILERVLDKGIVIVGDIQVRLLDIELLTIKVRLLVASLERAREMGIDWWETDPFLSSRAREQELPRTPTRRLQDRVKALERQLKPPATRAPETPSRKRRTTH